MVADQKIVHGEGQELGAISSGVSLFPWWQENELWIGWALFLVG